MSGRLARPISSTSRNPRVVTSAVGTPRRSVMELMTTVVPWTRDSIDEAGTPDRSRAAITPSSSWAGVVGALVTTSSPVATSTAARSVNVPPMSMATRCPISPSSARTPIRARDSMPSGATHMLPRIREPARVAKSPGGASLDRWKERTMRTESRPNSDYTRTWSPSGQIEYAELADGTRLRYLKVGSGRTALILLHTIRTQLDHFQLVVPKILYAF